jgi:bacteriorhodopsin|nr:proteorhodopsin [uncultured bacterium]|tara:strand:+ start:2671 stop:3354 length:684 start_codon:yes stop_codon:yes gene_type:complete
MGFTEFTFFVTNMALLATGLFLWLERDNVNPKWKTALTVSGMVCFIAAVHYYYMRGNLDATDVVSIRYIDWLITVPLQMVEFYIVLAAVTAVSAGVLNRLLGFSVLMLIFGYLGEVNVANADALVTPVVGFAGGMLCWGLMLREIWSGEAAEVNAGSKNAAAAYAFDGMKKIVTFGWAIYPLGYFLGYFTTGGVDMDLTNQVYNLADFVNKILIGMIVYAAAKMDTK